MTASERDAKGELFWDLARDLMADPAVTRGTMMGLPCLRLNGAFFASLEPKTGDLIVGSRSNDTTARSGGLFFGKRKPSLAMTERRFATSSRLRRARMRDGPVHPAERRS